MKTLGRATGILASVGLAIVWQTAASATPVPVVQLSDGVNAGPQEENGGPGAEQADITYIQKGSDVYVVSVWMSSKVSDNDGPWQCKCSSVKLSPTSQPEVVADQVQISDYDGDRPCNHPRLAADENGHAVYLFGSDMNNATNVSTYAGVLNEMCEVTAEPQRISENANNNEGAPDVAYNGNGVFTGGYLSTGGTDISYAVGLTVGADGSLDKTYLKNVVSPANIGRPAIVATAPDRSFFCAAKGDNRPPEVGVVCAMLDSTTGDVLYKQLIAASQPGEKIYMNQPTVGVLDYGRVAVQVLQSSGEGKTNNKKGSNTTNLYVLQPTDSTFIVEDHKVGLGSYQTHSAICSGQYGTDGARKVGIFGAPITGNGQPVLQMVGFDSTAGITIDKDKDKWITGWYADSGKLANLYGQNPNTQGRDFLRCLGDVPNPGFGQATGYLPNVKSFFVTPHAGRIPGEEKNSQWLSFVPGVTSEAVTPDPPAQSTDVALGPQGNDPVTSGPPPPADGSTGGDPATDGKGGIQVASGCSTSGRDRDGNGGLLVVMFGVGLALASRRRKEG